MAMTAERWNTTTAYLADVCGESGGPLVGHAERAKAAGLPSIAVSADVGRVLSVLTSLTQAQTVVEVGTLGGYSTMWLARSVRPGGKVHTIELSENHAQFAQSEFDRAGLADRIQIHRGAALDVLPGLVTQLGPQSVDVVFLDAVKREYASYVDLLADSIVPGGLLLADNVLSAGSSWVGDGTQWAEVMDAFNRRIVADSRFETAILSQREGLMVARRREASP